MYFMAHKPTILITNQMERPASKLIDRYARRMVIENVISDAIDFFHMDALSSAAPMRINVDIQLTVMAACCIVFWESESVTGMKNPKQEPSTGIWSNIMETSSSPKTKSWSSCRQGPKPTT